MPLGPGGAVAFAPLSPSDCLFNPDFNPAASPSCSPSKHAYISPPKGALKGVPAFVTSAARPVTTHHQLGSLRMVERLSPPRNVRRLLRLAPCAHAAPRPYRARAIPATSPPGLAARAPTHTGHGVARGAQRGLLPELAQRGGRRRLKASRRPPRMHFSISMTRGVMWMNSLQQGLAACACQATLSARLSMWVLKGQLW